MVPDVLACLIYAMRQGAYPFAIGIATVAKSLAVFAEESGHPSCTASELHDYSLREVRKGVTVRFAAPHNRKVVSGVTKSLSLNVFIKCLNNIAADTTFRRGVR